MNRTEADRMKPRLLDEQDFENESRRDRADGAPIRLVRVRNHPVMPAGKRLPDEKQPRRRQAEAAR